MVSRIKPLCFDEGLKYAEGAMCACRVQRICGLEIPLKGVFGKSFFSSYVVGTNPLI